MKAPADRSLSAFLRADLHAPCLALPIFHRPPPAGLAVLRGWPARLRPSHFLKDENAMLRFLFNLLWFILGGLPMALGWWLAGVIMAITLIGLPWARACFVIGQFALWPFGREAVDRRQVTGRDDLGTGALGLLGNLVWFVFAGLWLALGHLGSALVCFVTLIGIPFGWQHLKLAAIALMPIGKTIVVRR